MAICVKSAPQLENQHYRPFGSTTGGSDDFRSYKDCGIDLCHVLVFPRLFVAQMQTKSTEADSTAVKRVTVANYYSALNQHDAHAVGALFAEEGDFTNMRGASRHGRKTLNRIMETCSQAD